jgi:hypothetical protein
LIVDEGSTGPQSQRIGQNWQETNPVVNRSGREINGDVELVMTTYPTIRRRGSL